VHSFTESYLSDTDNTVLFDNTTPVNQNKKGQNKRTQSRLIRLIWVVFSNGALFYVLLSDCRIDNVLINSQWRHTHANITLYRRCRLWKFW